ncbi:MAG: DegV family protein [Gammaproteobacteria bacterium]|nr:DegV family protein [Gammaproteobacteria bacterium]MCP5196786.1 DegV family protein [Gammaproteobacteria bacterium]
MRTGIVIDSACDLPQSYIQEHNIHIMPISLHFGYDLFKDARDPKATQAFYCKYLVEKTLDIETAPFSVEQIRELFLEELVLKYDRVLVITIAQTRSPIFANASEASYAILKQYRERRQKAGMSGSFYLTVLDSKTLFTGEGVLVHEAVRLLEEQNPSFGVLRGVVEQLSQQVYGYLVPEDLFYIRQRASKKGEKSVGLIGYHFGTLLDIKPIIGFHRGESQTVDKDRGFDRALIKLFNIGRQSIDRGLATRIINTSYAGDPEVIRHKRAFVDFERYAKDHGVEVLLSVMSTAGGINVGPGAFALAYIAGPPVAIPHITGNDMTDDIKAASELDPSPAEWII